MEKSCSKNGNFIKLTTERLILRDHIFDDLASHYALMSDDKVMYYLDDIQTHTLEDAAQNLYTAINEETAAERKYYFFRVEIKQTGEHVGEMGYTVMERTPAGKIVQVGYFTHEKFWGKGYATEALRELTRFAFENDDVYRITIGCIKENKGSECVMKKSGYIKEGDFRHMVYHDGKMKDRVQYSLIKDEWKK